MTIGLATVDKTSVQSEIPHFTFEVARSHERELLQDVMSRGRGVRWSVWRTEKCLVVPRAMSTLECFDDATARMADEGWPVYTRDTGGDVTPQCPGIINVSYVFMLTNRSEQNVQQSYVRFCAPLLAYLADHGVEPYLGSVERAFCDGAYNIVVGGKKLAGTAQRWRPFTTSDGEQAMVGLAHAAILAKPTLSDSISATNAFYKHCRVQRFVDERQHVTLAEILPRWSNTTSYAASLYYYLNGSVVD